MGPIQLACCLALAFIGCANDSTRGGGPSDLAQMMPFDGERLPTPDFARAAPDLSMPGDGPLADGGVVICNLGNDPLPCTTDAMCTGAGAMCDSNRRYCVCITPNCTPGQDQTCNDDPMIASFHGRCLGSGSCQCLNGFAKSPKTGKCL